MLDPHNYKALSYKDAVHYSKEKNLVIIEAKELIAYAKSYGN